MTIRLLPAVIKSPKTPIMIFLLAASLITLFPPYESKNGSEIVFDFLLNGSIKYYSYPVTNEQMIYDDLKDCKILENAASYRFLNAGIDTSYNWSWTRNKNSGRFEVLRGEVESIRSYKNYSVTEKRWASFIGNLSISRLILEYILSLLVCSGYYVIIRGKLKYSK